MNSFTHTVIAMKQDAKQKVNNGQSIAGILHSRSHSKKIITDDVKI